MKKNQILFIVVAIMVVMSFSLSSCKKDNTVIMPVCRTCFDISSLDAQLKKRLDGNCIGYGYEISIKGNTFSTRQWGLERLSQDGIIKSFSVNDKFNNASLSKMITGIALIQELNRLGISIDAPMYPYLPPASDGWSLGPNIKDISFRDLLTYKSGFRTIVYLTDYNALISLVAAGVDPKDTLVHWYNNFNFSLMRILIPRLDGQTFIPIPYVDYATQYGRAYEKYVNKYIFSPMNLPYIYTYPTDQISPLCYNFPDDGKQGTNWGDYLTNNAQAGWTMSVTQFSQVMRVAFFTPMLLSATLSQSMRYHKLAFNPEPSGITPIMKMKYVCKLGGFASADTCKFFNAVYILFGNDVGITLYINSLLNYKGKNDILGLVIDAFESSIS